MHATREPDDSRFWGQVEIGADDECWPWLGAVDTRTGIGRYRGFGRGCRDLSARRRGWELTNGPAGASQVMVTCETPHCVNPAHLYLRSDLERRFWSKVEKTDGCWEWTAARNTYGYGNVRLGQMVGAHRVAYELIKGKIPADLQLDHLCRNHACVNPDHLEPVTQHENCLRGWASRQGA